MAEKLKVGIIGVGGIASVHVPGWRESEHAELAAGADVDRERLQRWGEEEGITKTFVDPADLIADPSIDIVDICTPNRYHAPLAIAALEAGKHVLCEKPLAPTPEEVRRMIAARNASGRMLMTAQSVRFDGKSLAMKTEIDRGCLGDVYHARGWYLRRSGVPTTPGFYERQHSGGGPTIDLGVHMLDQILWFMGNPQPVAVSGVARTEIAHQQGAFSSWDRSAIADSFDVEDFAAAFVRFENGATLILEVSWLLHGQDSSQVWLYGSKGGCHWPSCTFFESNYQTQQHYDRELKLTDSTSMFVRECCEFARTIALGEPSPVPAEQSLQVMEILDGIYRSQKTGREVSIE